MTTERIDVLAVLEASAKRLRLGVEGPANADALDEARAAIAELIEALRETDKDLTVLLSNIADAATRDSKWEGMHGVVSVWRERNRAALARIGAP